MEALSSGYDGFTITFLEDPLFFAFICAFRNTMRHMWIHVVRKTLMITVYFLLRCHVFL